jgi:hypothetical protein
VTPKNLLNNAALLILEVMNAEKDERRKAQLCLLYTHTREMQDIYREKKE